MTLRPLLRWIVAFAALLTLGAPARAGSEVTSAHYVLVSEGPEAEARELSMLLEAAWPQMETFFGAAPKLAKDERLRVRFFETSEAMRAAIVAGGGVAPDSGGYYCPVARTSYAFRQPSRWYTRTLLLHEAIHQFHLRSVASGARAMPASWWQEGIAEHLSHHTWDGTTLRLGVVPAVSLEDRSGAALEAARAKDYAPERIAELPLDRPQAMHLVRFLAMGDSGKPSPRWRDLAKSLDRGEVARPRDVTKGFATAAAFRERYAAWLPTVQQPLLSAFVEWDATGPASIRGHGAVVAACRTRWPATSVEATATVQDPAKPWRVGVVLEYLAADDYVIAQVTSDARVRVDRRRAGAWTTLHEGPVPDGAAAPWRVAARRADDVVTFRLGDADVYSLSAYPGPLGFCLDACTADFREIRIEQRRP